MGMGRLDGRHVLVIGSNRGIGAAIARRVAEDGATVACGARDPAAAAATAEDLERTGLLAYPVVTDLDDRASLDAAIAACVEAAGPLDGLVQSGAITSTTHFLDIDPEEWSRVLRTNVDGTFHACQAFARDMVGRERPGSVVVVSSQLSQVALPNKAPYVTSKGAMQMLVKAMAVDLAPHKIRVNALAPGVTQTDMAMSRLTADDDAMEWTTARVPMGRLAEPEEMGGAVTFLLSDDASYMTAATMVLDGGYLAW